jgi:hypothetical protein
MTSRSIARDRRAPALVGYGALTAGALALFAFDAWAWGAAVLAGTALGWGLVNPRRRTYAIFAVAFFLPVTVDFGYPTYPAWSVLALLFVLGLGAQLATLPRDGLDLPLTAMTMVIPAAIFVASLFAWRGLGPAAAGVAPWACFGVLAGHVIVVARRDPDGMRRLAAFFSWVGVAVALLAIYQRWTRTWPILDDFAVDVAFMARSGPNRSAGLMGHPLIYGTFAMGMACVALGLRFRHWPIAFTANVIGLVLSGTRSAWAAMLGALALWYLARPRKVSRNGVVGAAAGVASLLAVWKLGPPAIGDAVEIATDRVENLTGSESALARYARSGTALEGITRDAWTSIFGHGPEAHVQFFRTVGIRDGLAQTFDNTYLTMWYNSGVIGLAALIFVLVTVLLRYRSLTGRMIVGAVAVQILFFDIHLWPCAAAVALLGLGIAVADAPDGRMQPLDRDTLAITRSSS